MSQDAPSNASELVGERDGENVRSRELLLGRFEPAARAGAKSRRRFYEYIRGAYRRRL